MEGRKQFASRPDAIGGHERNRAAVSISGTEVPGCGTKRRVVVAVGRAVAVSIFHVGLPLDHPSIPAEERPNIAKRLGDLRERMIGAGYPYEIIHASPDTGLEAFKQQLRTQPCDGVLIGGGVAGNEAMSYFMEQIIDVTHQLVPRAKIMFYNHSVDVRTIVERWFGSVEE